MSRGIDYVGVDRNAAMLERASRRVTASAGKGVLVRADVTALPFWKRSIRRSVLWRSLVTNGTLAWFWEAERLAALEPLVRNRAKA